MLSNILRTGFDVANQHVGLVFLDFFWKFVWFLLCAAVLLAAAGWLTSDFQDVSWQDTGARELNLLIAAALLREFWIAHRGEIVVTAGFVMTFSICAWFLLEAFFRRKIAGAGFAPPLQAPFQTFLLSNAAKSLIIGAACVFLVPAAFAGAATIAIVTIAALAFYVTLLDSLIRADAVDLLGTDLFRVAGLLGILMSVELLIGAPVAALLASALLRVAGPVDAVLALGASVAVIVFLSFLHSYLLIVRFSAIAIMRRNVVQV